MPWTASTAWTTKSRASLLRGTGANDGFCQVRPEVRRLVSFRQVNLMDERWPLKSRCDVIFCRNVLDLFRCG